MKKIITVFIVVIIGVTLMFPLVSLASPRCDEALITGPTQIRSGELLTLRFTMNLVDVRGMQGRISYNAETMELTEIKSLLDVRWPLEYSGDEGIKYFALFNKDTSTLIGTNDIFEIIFKIKDVTPQSNISAKIDDIVLTNGDKSVTGKSCMFESKTQDPVSENVYLESLSVDRFNFNPVFSPTQFSYNMTVPYTCEKLNITAVPKNKSCKIEIENNILPENETVPVRIKVIAENGESSVYTLYTCRDKNPEYIPSSMTDLEGLELSDGATRPEFSNFVNQYDVDISSNVVDFYVKPIFGEGIVGYYFIDGDGAMKLGTNKVILTVIAEDKTTTRIINLNINRLENLDNPQKDENQNEGNNKIDNKVILWTIVISIAAILAVAIIIISLYSVGKKKNGKK